MARQPSADRHQSRSILQDAAPPGHGRGCYAPRQCRTSMVRSRIGGEEMPHAPRAWHCGRVAAHGSGRWGAGRERSDLAGSGGGRHRPARRADRAKPRSGQHADPAAGGHRPHGAGEPASRARRAGRRGGAERGAGQPVPADSLPTAGSRLPLTGSPQGLAVLCQRHALRCAFRRHGELGPHPGYCHRARRVGRLRSRVRLERAGRCHNGEAAGRLHLSRRPARAIRRLIRAHPGIGAIRGTIGQRRRLHRDQRPEREWLARPLALAAAAGLRRHRLSRRQVGGPPLHDRREQRPHRQWLVASAAARGRPQRGIHLPG